MINDYSGRFKLLLKVNNVTITDFCKIIGLNSSGTISKLIADNRKPSGKTVDRVIEAFPEVTEDWLLFGRGSYGKDPNKKLAHEDDLTLTSSQVISFIKNVVPQHIDQRDNQTASIILDRLNDIDQKFEAITEKSHAMQDDNNDKLDNIVHDFLIDISKRLTELEKYTYIKMKSDKRKEEQEQTKKRNTKKNK